MTMAIDLNRGVIATRMPIAKGGMYVYMYVDTPGEYLNEHGHKVSEGLAREVGFDVARWAKERVKRERMLEARKSIEAELEMLSEDTEKVVKEVNGFKIIELVSGSANVLDQSGALMNFQPIPMEDAEVLLKALTEISAPAKGA